MACLLNLVFEQEKHTQGGLEKFRAKIKFRKTIILVVDIAVYGMYAA